MGSTFLSLHYHLVFGTKERRPLLRAEWRPRLHEYLGGTIRGLEAVPEAIGGVEDHVHLLIGLKATHTLSDFVRELKKASSTWVQAQEDPLCGWQDGYAAFTVGAPQLDSVGKYIARQEEHHRQQNFAEELAALLEKAGVKYDPKYLL